MESRSSKKVSTACSYCKHRKRKCSTTWPCGNCAANGQLCVYGNETDGRRRESIRRVRLELSFLHTLLHSLLEKLRQGKDETLGAMIRERRPIEDFAAYLTVTMPPPCFDQNDATVPLNVDNSKIRDSQDSSFGWSSTMSQTLSLTRITHPDTAIVRRLDESGDYSPSTANPATGFTTHLPAHHASNAQLQPYKLLPLNFPVGHRSLTALLTTFRDACRSAVHSSVSGHGILGSQHVDLDAITNGSLTYDAASLTPWMWIHGILQKFENLDKYVRLIYVHLVGCFLRWTISSTVENYNLLPECMVPTECQRLIPHHAVLDICHLPALRDILVRRDYVGHTDDAEFLTAFQLAGVRTGWYGSWEDAVYFDRRLGYRTLTPRFIQQASKVEEWTAGSALLKDFPDLHGQMHFAAEEVILVDDRPLADLLRGCF